MSAPTPSEVDVAILLRHPADAVIDNLQNLLDYIECPDDFRGLKVVINFLERLANTYPELFKRTFHFDPSIFVFFSDVDAGHWADYGVSKVANGWMSQRPVYSLLITLAGIDSGYSFRSLLIFLQHFFVNEKFISDMKKEEDCFRAFRLTFLDKRFHHDCIESQDLQMNSQKLDQFLTYQQANTVLDRDKNFEGYIRELKHFYSLDWQPRQHRTRSRTKSFRASFRSKVVERITGSEELYALEMKGVELTEDEINSGLEGTEDFPACAIVKFEPEVAERPAHELPNISAVKDVDKQQAKRRAITQKTGRGHNINITHRTVLQPHELYALWQEINLSKRKDISRLPAARVQQAVLMSLLTARTIKELTQLSIIERQSSDGEGFFESNGTWYWKSEVIATADRGKHSNNPSLCKTKQFSLIQIPDELVKLLALETMIVGEPLFERATLLQKAVDQFYRSTNKKYHLQISQKRVERFLVNFSQSTGACDPVHLEHLRGVGYYTRSMRHYAWKTDDKLTTSIWSLWQAVFDYMGLASEEHELPKFSVPLSHGDESIGTGSQFTPTKSALKQLVNELKEPLHASSPFQLTCSLEQSINYHNAYTVYTLFMLLNATGYRAVHNPFPSFSLNLQRYGLLGISDKDASKNLAHSRLVVTPEVLQRQLLHYRHHLEAMASLLTGTYAYESMNMHRQSVSSLHFQTEGKIERLEWLAYIKHSKRNDGNFVLFQKDSEGLYKTVNAGPNVVSRLCNSTIDIPLNFGRHYVRYFLQKQDVAQELIQFQLGHFNYGELALGYYSALDHVTVVQELSEMLQMMMLDLGWSEIPSLLTRKRK